MLSNFGRTKQETLEQELKELVDKSRNEMTGLQLAAERWVGYE